MKNYLYCMALLLLTACQGAPLGEIRQQSPIFKMASSKSISTVTNCITSNQLFLDFEGNIKTLTLPDTKTVEFRIGAEQLGEFKNFYLLTLFPSKRGTEINLRKSETDFPRLSVNRLKSLITECSN